MLDNDQSKSDSAPLRHDEISFLGLVNVLLRERILIASVALVCLAAAIALSLAAPRTYSSTTAFMPQSRRAASPLSGLAAQFGIAVPSSDASQSPAFYADLLKTRQLLDRAVESRYTIESPAGVRKRTLVDFYDMEGVDSIQRRTVASRRLDKSTTATVSQKTGVVQLRVTSEQPVLSQEIAARLLELINEFNRATRRSQASAERIFAEQRLAEVKVQLRQAEDGLQFFLLNNRQYRNSPILTFQAQRLEREVGNIQTVYTSLAQAYEQAKMEEVRDMPVITIVDPPTVPVRPDGRGMVRRGVLFLFFGLVITVMVALSRSVRYPSPPHDERDEFRRLWQATWSDLLHPWRPMQRAMRSSSSSRRPA